MYGEALYRRLYGELVPLPKERVLVTHDLERLSLAGRQFEFVHTPGHALHHHAIVDLQHSGIFTGDTFGLSYREMDTAKGAFVLPATPPSQFDPEQLLHSVDRLAAYAPRYLYLMHYGRVTDVPRLAQELKHQIREFARIALEHADSSDPASAIGSALRDLWRDLARRHGCDFTDAGFDAVSYTHLDVYKRQVRSAHDDDPIAVEVALQADPHQQRTDVFDRVLAQHAVVERKKAPAIAG